MKKLFLLFLILFVTGCVTKNQCDFDPGVDIKQKEKTQEQPRNQSTVEQITDSIEVSPKASVSCAF